MAKKKESDGAVEIKPGTVEWERQQFFEREKAAYEERTGEKVNYVPPAPLTSTPLPATPAAAAEPADEPQPSAEGEG